MTANTENTYRMEQKFAMGNTEYSNKNYAEAISHYKEAIAMNSDYAADWFNKWMDYYEKDGGYTEAMRCWERRLALNPDYRNDLANPKVLIYHIL